MNKNIYLNQPANFAEMYMFKLYLCILIRLQNINPKIKIITNNSRYTTNSEILLLLNDFSIKKQVSLNYETIDDKEFLNQSIDEFILSFKSIDTEDDLYLSYEYNKFSIFVSKLKEKYTDIISVMNSYDKFDEKFYQKFNIIRQLKFKTDKIVVLNISTKNNLVLPDIYYIKALAVIFKTNNMSESDIENTKIIVCYDNKITDELINKFIDNITSKLKYITSKNFILYKELLSIFSTITPEELKFYINKLGCPSVCSQNITDLLSCFLKLSINTLESKLPNLTIFSKKLFANTLVHRSIGI